jgi:class 3 adenylate cyclase/tetratricopeptide (TPR) repeat protein
MLDYRLNRSATVDIAAWLRRLDLQQYEAAFREHAIDAAVLPCLTAEDLKELGVAPVGHRRKLLDAIAALRASSPADEAIGSIGKLARAKSSAMPVGERRQVAVLFADLAGYTRLSTELDPEAVHALLSAFFEAADRIVAEHGGAVDKHIGDSVTAVFGAPVAHGNDAERAARAALAIRDVMPALATGLERPVGVHIGIASGEVVASDIGGPGHRAYTVTGESVNLASRLTAAAGAGEILVSAAMHEVLAERMEFAEPIDLLVNGIAKSVRAWRLAGPRRTATPAAPRSFVGREPERRLFSATLSACLETGRGQTIYIRGEAGIGKTRLVEELRRAATEAGFDCHVALVLDFGAGAGRDAIGSLVRSLLGMPPSATAEEAREGLRAALAAGLAPAEHAVFLHDLLALAPPPELRALADATDHATRVRGARQATQRLLERASAARPLLLIAEDLHWADEATLESVAALAGTTDCCRALLVATTRIDGDPLGRGWRIEGPLLTMDLAPLRSEEVRLLAISLLTDRSAAFAARCVERAGGNPLFLEQLTRHAAERTANDAVPDTVQSLVQARLDRLAPGLKQALQAATVFGQRFSVAGLRHLLEDPSCDADDLLRHHLVRPDGEELLFGHALIRDAVYATLLRSRRRDLHRRAAAWFAERGDHSLRAEHLDRAEDRDAAAAYLEAAAAQAGLYRYEAALAHTERGLALARDPASRFALACRRGDLLHDLGRTAEARGAYEAALAAARSDDERCRVWLGLAAVKRIADDLEGAFADLARAEAVASRLGLKAEAARVHFLRGNLLFPRGELDRCLAEHRASLELAREAGSAELEAAALGGLGDAEYVSGRMLSAHERFRDCVALSRRHGFGRIEVANRPMMAFTQLVAGDTHGALAAAEEAIATARRVGHLRAEMIGHHGAWFCRHSLAEFDAARVHADAALALSHHLGARRFDAEALAFQAELHRRAGRNREAVAAAEEAVEITRDTGVAYIGPFALGILAMATDDRAAREDLLTAAEAILDAGAVSHNHLLFRRDAIEICLDDQDWGRAEHHAAALAAYAQREPSPWSTFVVARRRALVEFGRGDRGAGVKEELLRLRDEAKRLGLLIALPSILEALKM